MDVAERVPEWYKKEVGARVALARQALGLTQEGLGRRLKRGNTAIANYENGKRLIEPLTIAEWRDLDKVDSNWLYHGDLSKLPYDLASAIQLLLAKSA